MVTINGRIFEDELCWGVFPEGHEGCDLASMDEGEDAVFMTQGNASEWCNKNLRNGRVATVRLGSFGWEETDH